MKEVYAFNVMLVVRSALFYLVLTVYTIFWASLSMIVGPFLPFRARYIFIIHWWTRFVMVWLRISCGITYVVEGKENIPQKPCILYSKHQSTWETFFLQTLFIPQTQVIKRELLSIPFFGWAFKLVSPIAIDRRDRRTAMNQVISQGKERLRDGIWVLIFPEGTRVNPGQRRPFTKGGARLAEASGYPLLPIAHNAGEHWPNNKFLKYPGQIRVVIGPQIHPAGKSADQMTEEGQRWIDETVERISRIKYQGEVSEAVQRNAVEGKLPS